MALSILSVACWLGVLVGCWAATLGAVKNRHGLYIPSGMVGGYSE